ncbi:MAG TPA: DNA repair exonuclease [Thermoguttaceae bacterium]|nr:DNA repair exonuclease [Thermoguttaceae bacterium]
MSQRPFCFVHASDFHLELPPMGLAEVPDHLRELFIESAYWAAERVFETVLSEEAEFLVLAGDLLHPNHTGPRGPLFLVEQFHRLAERKIPVYWAGGTVDPPDAWPSAVSLPENVHIFPRGRIEEFLHERDGTPLARLMGVSRDRPQSIRAADFEPDPGGLFSIAVAHGAAETEALQARNVHYWALGSRHDRSTLLSSPHVAHYPGSPQGRRPEEHGTHGCTLVQVDQQRQARTSLIPTDVMRWLSERVVIDEETTREDLETLLRERMHTLVETTPAVDLLISWTIAGSGPMLNALRRGGLKDELLGWLRSEYGFGPPVAWSASLGVEFSAGLPPQWYEQETIRGDFLRAIRQLQMNAGEPIDLEPYVAEEHLAGTLGSLLTVADRPARDRVLSEAALLGVDLLSGEEAQA